MTNPPAPSNPRPIEPTPYVTAPARPWYRTRWWLRSRQFRDMSAGVPIIAQELYVPWWAWPIEGLHLLFVGAPSFAIELQRASAAKAEEDRRRLWFKRIAASQRELDAQYESWQEQSDLACRPETGESPAPIDMILYCPNCGRQHVDAPEWQHEFSDNGQGVMSEAEARAAGLWMNDPHRSHQCHYCTGADGKPFVWRPADTPTRGVAAITTAGKADSAPPAYPHSAWTAERELRELYAVIFRDGGNMHDRMQLAPMVESDGFGLIPPTLDEAVREWATLNLLAQGHAQPAGRCLCPAGRCVAVTSEDANRFCQILTLLGMEEEGDPVAEVERLVKLGQNEAINKGNKHG